MSLLFLLLGIPPTMYISRESWNLGEYKNQKIFLFLMPFCNQNDLNVKIWILAKSGPFWIFYARNRKKSNYFERFFSRRALSVLITPQIIFGQYSAEKSIFREFCWCMVGKFFFKIDFFRFFQKCAKSCLDITYGLETGFKHFEGDFDAIFDDLYII